MIPSTYGPQAIRGLHGFHGGRGGHGIVRLIAHLAIWHAIWRHPLIGWPLVALFIAVVVVLVLRNRRRPG